MRQMLMLALCAVVVVSGCHRTVPGNGTSHGSWSYETIKVTEGAYSFRLVSPEGREVVSGKPLVENAICAPAEAHNSEMLVVSPGSGEAIVFLSRPNQVLDPRIIGISSEVLGAPSWDKAKTILLAVSPAPDRLVATVANNQLVVMDIKRTAGWWKNLPRMPKAIKIVAGNVQLDGTVCRLADMNKASSKDVFQLPFDVRRLE